MSRRKSVIWDYFTVENENKAKCGLCRAIIKFSNSSTSNIKRHLLSRHPTVNLNENRRQNIIEHNEDGPPQLPQPSQPVQPPPQIIIQRDQQNQDPSPRPGLGRQNMANIRQYLHQPMSAHRRKLLDEQLIRMIVKEYHPFRIVEEKEFQNFVKMLNPGYSLPTRKTLANSLLPVLYEKVHNEVSQKLDKAEYVSLTTDGWSSITNESFYAVTAHYISEESGQLSCSVLGCERFPQIRHDADNISIFIKTILEKWNLTNKITAITTDNAPVMIAAVRKLKIRHIGCFAHTLNLIVQTSLAEISDIRSKVKNIVEYFKRSNSAYDKLKKYQEQNNITPALSLIQDVPTRWNSTYYMFERLIKIKLPLITTMADIGYESGLSGSDWHIILLCIDALKIFEKVTKEISSEKEVTISKLNYLSQVLLDQTTKLKASDIFVTPDLMMKMYNVLFNECNKRLFVTESSSKFLLNESTFLDPRYKNQGFRNNQIYQDTRRSIENRGLDILRVNRPPAIIETAETDVVASTSATTDFTEDSIWASFDEKVKNIVQKTTTPASRIVVEIDRYVNEPLLHRTNDPLQWWQESKKSFPTLYSIMKKRLCIQATSVPSERVFSKSGEILSAKRSRLTNKRFSQIIFLNNNLE